MAQASDVKSAARYFSPRAARRHRRALGLTIPLPGCVPTSRLCFIRRRQYNRVGIVGSELVPRNPWLASFRRGKLRAVRKALLSIAESGCRCITGAPAALWFPSSHIGFSEQYRLRV